jgi:hypothetical protein
MGPCCGLPTILREDAVPGWSSDGRFVYFASTRGNRSGGLHPASRRGREAEPLVVREEDWGSFSQISRRMVSWVVAGSGASQDQVGSPPHRGLPPGPGHHGDPAAGFRLRPRVAPDLTGRALAGLRLPGVRGVGDLRPALPGRGSGRWVVSRGGGFGPRWARSGRELFYVSGDRVMMAATVELGETFRVTERRALFSPPIDVSCRMDPFDVSPDDQRFIMMRAVESGEASRTSSHGPGGELGGGGEGEDEGPAALGVGGIAAAGSAAVPARGIAPTPAGINVATPSSNPAANCDSSLSTSWHRDGWAHSVDTTRVP